MHPSSEKRSCRWRVLLAAVLGAGLASSSGARALPSWGAAPQEALDDDAGRTRAVPVETADDTEYANEPYWYKPGHPLNPADSSDIQALPGFVAERILTVPRELGSWTALAVDDRGRLITSAQQQGGLYRVTPPDPLDPESQTRVDRLGGVAEQVGWSHGLLHAFGSLYVNVAEENETTSTGLYRLRDTDGDDQYDAMELLFAFEPAGEHGPHNLVPGPDGETLYMIGGNGRQPPGDIVRRRPVVTTGVDHLMPPGFDSSEYTTAGWVLRFRPDGSERELIGAGLRNSYDLAFNRRGDLFTFDSDMEWDLGAPWYRPTRVCQVVSGSEFGWRGDAAKWPEYYEDSVPPVVNVGPGSPTGVVFGYGTAYPKRYRDALFVADWTFGAINAVHLRSEGAGYAADFEEFVGGTGLPVTNVVVGGDGALYFIVGGRRLGSAVYRVRYTGSDVAPDREDTSPLPEAHALRRRLEGFHGRTDPRAVDEAWPHLGDPDRLVRFAARVAVEAQPVATWQERALGESNPATAPTALLALARQGPRESMDAVLRRADALPWDTFTAEERLTTLRIVELALARSGEDTGEGREATRLALRGRFPDTDARVDRELSRLLCFLGDATMIDPVLDIMAADTGSRPVLGVAGFSRNPKYGEAIRDMLESAPLVERMHHAQMLLWLQDGWTLEQRRRYFKLIADARVRSKGGYTYEDLWDRIAEVALDQVPPDARASLEEISAASGSVAEGLPTPKGPGQEWTLEEALALVEDGLSNRSFEGGQRAYAASGCALCHRLGSQGGGNGPNLTTIGQRFTIHDILDSIINPSRTISSQYRVSVVETRDGRELSGRVVTRDGQTTRIAEDLMRPGQTTAVSNEDILSIRPVPVSTMPSGLINVLGPEEVLDLVAYLAASGQSDAEVFASH